MRQNLFGEIVLEPADFAKTIIEGLNRKYHTFITPNGLSKKGFLKEGKDNIDKVGFYCIYKYKLPIYVGYSNSSIYHRIARFFGAATGNTLNYERHAAGEKYEKAFGQDYENLSVRSFHFDVSKLPLEFTMEEIEHEIIYELKPVLNSQVYKGLWVSNTHLTIVQNENV